MALPVLYSRILYKIGGQAHRQQRKRGSGIGEEPQQHLSQQEDTQETIQQHPKRKCILVRRRKAIGRIAIVVRHPVAYEEERALQQRHTTQVLKGINAVILLYGRVAGTAAYRILLVYSG